MKIAVIDLGINTFHLLIIDVNKKGYKIIYKEKIPVKIGEKSLQQGVITPEAQKRAVEAKLRFKQFIDQYTVDHIRAKATSALRTHEIIQQIKKETGIAIEVISGEAEADLIYKAVTQGMKMKHGTSLIMDIGGGSVECIICNKEKALWKQSFEIGAQRLVDLFYIHDPMLPEEVQNLKHYLNKQLQSLLKAALIYHFTKIIGTAGTFQALIKIYKLRTNQSDYKLSLDQFKALYDDILQKPRQERLKIPGLLC